MSLGYRFVFLGILLMSYSVQVVPTTVSEVCMILARYVQQPAQVGEIAPISQAAGIELAHFVQQDAQIPARRYLEAGGGCGAVSICIAKNLRPQDHLDVIELDPKMCILLKKRLQAYSNVTVYCCSILDWKPAYSYDAIISTLPFNSLGAAFTLQCIGLFQSLAKPNCTWSYVEYPIVRQLLQHMYGKERKAMFQEVQELMTNFRMTCIIGQKMVYRNVPPVMIYHLMLNGQ
ncbi:hypothetical protein KBD08_02720 [Candidatus Babeliales bacterium]|nr:hypothetical protein [Candidatus Babeliales bacterium]